MTGPDFKLLGATDLLAIYNRALAELRERGILCSHNNPVADYAEYLACNALQLTRVTKSTAGHDGIGSDGKRYQVKGRRITAANPSRQMGVIRNLDQRPFEYLVGIIFAEDFSIYRACLVPVEIVAEMAVHRKHVNGWIMFLRDGLWEKPGVRDITAEIRTAAAE